ncbi:MAG: CHAD domain-containing protein [Burkholderiaceae bacterium]
MPAAPAETELKLQLDPKEVSRLKRSGVLAAASRSEVDVENTYYDTSNRLLHRHGMALRVRKIDGKWLQTLKTGGKGGALSQRGEWEAPARVLRGRGRVDLPRLSASPLTKLFAAQKSRPVLQALFHTRFRRVRWLVGRDGSAIEVAIDIGEITASVGRETHRVPICEVELELKEGAPAALIEVAIELIAPAGGAPLTLTPVSRSKAERGYQMIDQRPPAAVKASAKGFVEELTRKTTTPRALRAVVAHGLAVLTANSELLQQTNDPECVHQARVALRRVRSAIRLFDRDGRDLPKSLADELHWMARVLGEARDWDVITDETLTSLVDGIGANALRQLVAKAEQLRQRAREQLRAALQSPRYAMLVLGGEKWCMTPVPADKELLGAAASPALESGAKKMFKAARFFSALAPERRHQVRILAKRLRYALDLFAVALPKASTTRYTDALSELQDSLGQMNDASVAVAVSPDLSPSRAIKKLMQKWLLSIEPERVRDAEMKLLALSKLQPPW